MSDQVPPHVAELAQHEAKESAQRRRGVSPRLITPVSAAALRSTKFPTPRSIVRRLLLEGLFLLAGSTKIGKSWLALLIALVKAMGGEVLGERTVAGKVAFLGLEDNLRRLQSRLAMLLQPGDVWPENLLLLDAAGWPWYEQDAVEQLQRFHDANQDLELLVIDTLKRLQGPQRKRGNAYDLDIEFVAPFQRFALERRLCLLGVAHTRKRDRRFKEVDVLESISGSLGLPATADGALVLDRGRLKNEGVLFATGRDLPERQLSLVFEPSMGLWSYRGEAAELPRSDEQRAVLDVLARRGAPMRLQELALATGKGYDATKVLVLRMTNHGLLCRFGPGLYSIPTPPPGELGVLSVPSVPGVPSVPWIPGGDELKGTLGGRPCVPVDQQGDSAQDRQAGTLGTGVSREVVEIDL